MLPQDGWTNRAVQARTGVGAAFKVALNHGAGRPQAFELAEDATQEAHRRSLTNDGFQSEAHFRLWLGRVSANVVRDHFRRAHRVRPLDPAYDPASAAADADGSPEEVAKLRSTLGRLDDLSRTLVRQRYFDGMTLEDIGKAHGHSTAWAFRRIEAAKSQLREMLERGPRLT